MKLTQITEQYELYNGIAITEQRSYHLWETAGVAIREAALTPAQIQKLFQQIEQDVTAAGSNRTLLGKGKDAASAVNKAWEDLKTKIQNTGPIKNMDAAYDSAIAKIEAGLGGPDNAINKVIQKYRKFAKEHPIAQSFIYAALIAAAGISGAGLGGAATLGLLKMTDKLLQGEKFSTAAYQGGKTGALAYGASKVGDYIKGKMAGDQPAAGSSSASDAAATIQYKGPGQLAREAQRIFQEKVANGEVTDYNSYQRGMQDAIDQAVQNVGGKVPSHGQQMAGEILRAKLDNVVAQANGGQFSGSGPQKVKELIKLLGGQPDEASLSRAQAAVDQLSRPPDPSQINAPGSDDWVNVGKDFKKVATSAPVDTSSYPTGGDSLGGPIGKPLDPSIAPTGPDGTPMKMVPMDEPASSAVSTAGSTEMPKGASMDPEYLKKAASGQPGRFLIGKDDAQAALDWQAQNGGPLKAASDAVQTASSGYSKEYLQKVVSGEHPRPLISKEKAQELLGQMVDNSGPSVSFTDGNSGILTLPSGDTVPAYAFPPDGIQPRLPPGSEVIKVNIGGKEVTGRIFNGKAYFPQFNPSAGLNESQIRNLFFLVASINTVINEGLWDKVKSAAGSAVNYVSTKGHNLTTKVTADKLNSAWKSAGSPTDSEELKKFLASQGIDATVVDTAYKAIGIGSAATTPAAPPVSGSQQVAAKQVGSNQAKQEIDQAVKSIQKVRSRDRQNVVKYAQTKFDGIIKQPATTEGKLIYSRFLKMDI